MKCAPMVKKVFKYLGIDYNWDVYVDYNFKRLGYDYTGQLRYVSASCMSISGGDTYTLLLPRDVDEDNDTYVREWVNNFIGLYGLPATREARLLFCILHELGHREDMMNRLNGDPLTMVSESKHIYGLYERYLKIYFKGRENAHAYNVYMTKLSGEREANEFVRKHIVDIAKVVGIL